jgi:peroxiredoxin
MPIMSPKNASFRVVVVGMLLASGGTLTGRTQVVDSSQGATEMAAPPLKAETQELVREGERALTSKHFEDAAKYFKKAMKAENEKCSRCYLGLAEAENHMSDMKGALSSCDRAVAVAANDTERAEGHAAKGDILLGSGDAKRLKEAEAEYQAALELRPALAETHIRMAIALFKESRDAEGREELAAYLKLAPSGRYAQYAKRLEDNPRRAREEYAPEFQVTTIKGQKISSGDFLGRVVVMDFWATWCPPCRASVGEIKELTKKYSSDKVVVLSVSADEDDAKWREFIEKKNMDWLQYRDADSHVLKLMDVHAFPTYIVIDTEGIIRERIVGENPQQTIVGRLKDKLQKMLPQG